MRRLPRGDCDCSGDWNHGDFFTIFDGTNMGQIWEKIWENDDLPSGCV